MAFEPDITQFIVYACPIGALAEQIDRFFEKSLVLCGANAAHRYMPHCTLTGFFHDIESSVPRYVEALDNALAYAQANYPEQPIQIKTLSFRDDWHGLELEADWLKALVADFARHADSPTRPDPLRLKSWLHLSLAYEFEPSQTVQLTHLAQTHIDIAADVGWELRYYQRIKVKDLQNSPNVEVTETRTTNGMTYGSDRWICHRVWRI